jgi:regulator of protease activity HflC (stomatin/prohibitin superfamily)
LIDKFTVLDESLKESLQKGCETWAPGIEIIAVRVTKPTVPASIAETFEDREVERTKLLIKKQEQRLSEKESEIEKKLSKIKAETESKVA